MLWGISAQVHDASLTVIDGDEILFAGHSERYSKVKQDPELHPQLLAEASRFGRPDLVVYYERPWVKKLRQFFTGFWKYAFDFSRLPARYLSKYRLNYPVRCVGHHLSHAAAGFYTCPYEEAAVVVIDSVGEWATISIWDGSRAGLKLLRSVWFPSSLGLLYSAFTKRCGLKPNEEEYILMGMAAFGEPVHYSRIMDDFIDQDAELFGLKRSCHYGVGDYLLDARPVDLAASVQAVAQHSVEKIMRATQRLTGRQNLVYMGGVALNCVINASLFKYFENVWVMPNPGDAGSSLGCAAAVLGQKLRWRGPYLGTNIKGNSNIERMCDALLRGEIVGMANGRAEFGPRALGNRSLLADPRLPDTKDRVNEIKQRQKYRPFAPAILAEHAADYFDLPTPECKYMQFVVKCKYPKDFPAICHVDGTSRVQTVSYKDNPPFYCLLKLYYERTGCPMLLNTSLNIRGKPIVNDWNDAQEFAKTYGVKVF